MTTRDIGYACVNCYIAAHDREYPSEYVEHDDVVHTDWTCSVGSPNINGFCEEDGDLCTNCEGVSTGFGLTVGGSCDLGEHQIDGYWEYHEYLI